MLKVTLFDDRKKDWERVSPAFINISKSRGHLIKKSKKLKKQNKQKKRNKNKRKGVYIQTSKSKVLAMLHLGYIETGVGDAGLKKKDQGDIDSRGVTLTNSKYRIEDHIEIGTIENPIGFNRDFDLYDLLSEIAPRIYKNNKPTELFRFEIKKEMRDRFFKNLGDKEWDDTAFEEIKIYIKDKVRGIASTFDPANYADVYDLRDCQKLVKQIVLDLVDKGVPVNIAAELAPRIGKTILFLDIILSLWKKDKISQAVVMAYGVGLSVFTSYMEEIKKFRDFKKYIEFIDADDKDSEQLHKKAIQDDKLPLIMTSLNASQWKNKYKWIHKLSTPTFGLLEESDFGGHCDRQVTMIKYLLANKLQLIRINTSGTNMGKIAKAMGGDKIDETITVPYSEVEKDISIKDVVKRKFYHMYFNQKLIKFLEDKELEDCPNITKILKKSRAQAKYVGPLLQSMLSYQDGAIYDMSLDDMAGETLKNIVLYVNLTKKEMDTLANVIEEFCDEHKVLCLHGDIPGMNNRTAQTKTKTAIKECEMGVHGKRRKLIVLTSMMGTRSYTVGKIQACVFMMDGGEVYPFMQKYSRCLSPLSKQDKLDNWLKKEFGHIFEFGFDYNKTNNILMSIAVEASQVAKLKNLSFPQALRRVLSSVGIKDHATGQWVNADDIVKKFEDIDRLMQAADAGKPIVPDEWTQEQIEIALSVTAGIDRSTKTKHKNLIKKGKTYELTNSNRNLNQDQDKDELLKAMKTTIKLINSGASSIYWLANYDKKNDVTGILSAIEKIKKDINASKDFSTLFGITPDQALKLENRLNIAVLDTIIENTKTGKTEKYSIFPSLGIVNVDEKLAWKKAFLKSIGRKINPNTSILCGCVGYGSEIEALIELYGIKVVNQITINDSISLFTNRLIRKYNVKIIKGDFLKIMKQFDYVTINSPFRQGLYRHFRKKGLELAKKKLLQIAPNDLDNRISKKYEENARQYKEGKIQKIISVHEFFSGLETSAPICIHEFDLTKKTYNKEIFDKPLSEEEKVYNKILKICESNGTLTEYTGGEQSSNPIPTIVSVKMEIGSVIEKINKKGVKVLSNAKDYFYVNKFFGMNNNDPVGEAQSDYFGYYKENVYVIDHSKKFTKKQFEHIYKSEPMRFILLFSMGSNRRIFGYSFSRLPIIDPKTKDVYKELGVNENDKNVIRNYLNNRTSNRTS